MMVLQTVGYLIALSLFAFECRSMAAEEVLRIKVVPKWEEKADSDAKNLLHEVYVVEGGWLPENDRTGIRVTKDASGRSLLVNDYDEVALRFNAMVNDTIVGTIRLAGSRDGLFEVEHYIDLPPLLAGMKAAALLRVFEVNRLAVLSEYRARRFVLEYGGARVTAFQALVNAVAEYAELRHWILIAAPKADMTRSLSKLDWTGWYGDFKYLPSDPNFVNFSFKHSRSVGSLNPEVDACFTIEGAMLHN